MPGLIHPTIPVEPLGDSALEGALLVGLSFVFLGVETHGKAMGIGDEEVRIEPRGVVLGAEPR